MPGYIIHLTEAKLIFDILKQKNKLDKEYFNEWLQDFSYGALLPDAVRKEQKADSHFWNRGQISCIVMAPQINCFLNKYNVSVDSAVLLGYLAHLDLDLKFWKEYMNKCVEFRDSNQNPTEDIRMVKSVFIRKSSKAILLEEFFSAEYLYGDYTKLNKYLIKKYNLNVPEYNQRYHNIVKEVKSEDMERVLANLKRYLMESEEKVLKVFSKDSLEKFIENTARQFCERVIAGKHEWK